MIATQARLPADSDVAAHHSGQGFQVNVRQNRSTTEAKNSHSCRNIDAQNAEHSPNRLQGEFAHAQPRGLQSRILF